MGQTELRLNGVLGSSAKVGSQKSMLVASKSSPRVPWVAKIFGPAKPLPSRVGDRQPVQQTLVVPQRQCLRLVVGLPVHRSLPPTRGTTTTLRLYPSLPKLNRTPGGGVSAGPIHRNT